jgi:hypothetical protein
VSGTCMAGCVHVPVVVHMHCPAGGGAGDPLAAAAPGLCGAHGWLVIRWCVWKLVWRAVAVDTLRS